MNINTRRPVWVVTLDDTVVGVYKTKALACKKAISLTVDDDRGRPDRSSCKYPYGQAESWRGETIDGDMYQIAVIPHLVRSKSV
jgi:hypothetical protein